jgi:translation initiation factor IF-2
MKPKATQETHKGIPRPPIVVVMGHIDHGKSTLLDHIRKTSVVEREAGGITQHLSAYEVVHTTSQGEERRITFLDTPGHEAFGKMRFRGAEIADIAILVVSAEDGVKAQTLEALKCIKHSKRPFVVAVNKIDKPNANIDRTTQNLLEHGVYLEKLGGDVPWVPISAKRGDGVPELLDIILLLAELTELTGEPSALAEGVVIESSVDAKTGIAGTLIIKNGALRKGMFVASGGSVSPVRVIHDYAGKSLDEASFSSPVRISGWDSVPEAGLPFASFESKQEAEIYARERRVQKQKTIVEVPEGMLVVPVILKADTAGSLDAIEHELLKLNSDRVSVRLVHRHVGVISEDDVKRALSAEGALVIGFNTKIDPTAADLARRNNIELKIFDIIYKLSQWLSETIKLRTPVIQTEEVAGRAKILKIFSRAKNKQVVGARAEQGVLTLKATVRIMRKETEIGRGSVISLQQHKSNVPKIEAGGEFGAQVESSFELMPGDYVETLAVTRK